MRLLKGSGPPACHAGAPYDQIRVKLKAWPTYLSSVPFVAFVAVSSDARRIPRLMKITITLSKLSFLSLKSMLLRALHSLQDRETEI